MKLISPPREIQVGPSTIVSSLVTVILRGLALTWLRIAPWAGPLLLLAVFAAIAFFSFIKPLYNWDMVAYLAAALKGSFSNFDDAHRQVFSILKVGLPEAIYQALIVGDAYRSRQFADPAALQSMLGMYDVKWLFVQLLKALGPNFGWLLAFQVINIASIALLFLSLWAWLSRFKLMVFAPLVAAVFMTLGLADTYRVQTPDFLAIALMTSGILMIDRGRIIAAILPLILGVLARPDNVAVVGMIALTFFALQDLRWKQLAIAAGIALSAYLFVSLLSSSPGWWAHLWFSTYDMQDTMVGFDPAFSFSVYLKAFAYNLARAVMENTWLGFYFAAIGALLWIVSESKNDERIRHPRMVIILGLTLAIAAKFMIFPLHDARTYFPVLFPLVLLIGAQMKLLYVGRQAAFVDA